jgi:hypothetical protein
VSRWFKPANAVNFCRCFRIALESANNLHSQLPLGKGDGPGSEMGTFFTRASRLELSVPYRFSRACNNRSKILRGVSGKSHGGDGSIGHYFHADRVGGCVVRSVLRGRGRFALQEIATATPICVCRSGSFVAAENHIALQGVPMLRQRAGIRRVGVISPALCKLAYHRVG